MNLFIVGISGKMGKAICENAPAYGHTVTGGIDRVKHPVYPTFDCAKQVDVPFDVIIDFSRPELLDEVIALASSSARPTIIATTGFSKQDEEKITKLASKVPVLKSANMSIGVAVLKKLCAYCHELLGDAFDVEIVEKHHNQKADCPSGTALALAATMPDLTPIYGRSGKRQSGEIGISSVRGGTVTGVHEVGFYGNGESITLTHNAEDRKLFAIGALKAASVLAEKAPGLYTEIL